MLYVFAAAIVIICTMMICYFLTTKPNVNPAQRPARSFHQDECAICLDDKRYPVQASCAHEFCAECILTCLEKSSLCPLCRRKISLLFKNFETCPDDLKARMKHFHQFQEERSYLDVILDAPLLLKRFFTHNDYQDARVTLFVILLILAGIGYLMLPADLVDEKRFGLFGLIDDFGIVFGSLIWASILIFKIALRLAIEGISA